MTVMYRLMWDQAHQTATKLLYCLVPKRQKSLGLAASNRSDPVNQQPKHSLAQYQLYPDMLNFRRNQAKRSVLIEIERLQDSGGVHQFCERLGNVNKYYLFKSSGKNFVLVEFRSDTTKKAAVKCGHHSKDPLSIPIASPFLYYHQASGKATSGHSFPDSTEDTVCDDRKIVAELGKLNCPPNERLLKDIQYVHQTSTISDLSMRLRFLTCHQLDLALEGMFQGVQALPFGSSVSGLGRNNGDLDIFLYFRRNIVKDQLQSKLFFHSKAQLRDKNLQLKLIGDLISIFLPGCTNVIRILTARVPIVKYRQSLTNMECDLQNSCAAGVDFNQLLWTMKHWDSRLAPLVYALRTWAGLNHICSAKKPSPFITNFAVTIMAIFYLQSINILPSLKSWHNLSNKDTISSLDPYCGLVFPDLRKVPTLITSVGNENYITVDALLLGFFEFYSKFQFSQGQISIFHGKTISKSSRSALEIENPASPNLNISQNVNQEALNVFIRAVNEAYKALAQDNYQSQSLKRILPPSLN